MRPRRAPPSRSTPTAAPAGSWSGTTTSSSSTSPGRAATRRTELPVRLLDLIAAGPPRGTWRATSSPRPPAGGSAACRSGDGERSVPAALLRHLAPLPAPPMVRDFYAYEDHVRRGFASRGSEIPDAWYEFPAFYKQNHRAIRGPDEELPWPSFTDELDYELEIAMVVGVGGRDIAGRGRPRARLRLHDHERRVRPRPAASGDAGPARAVEVEGLRHRARAGARDPRRGRPARPPPHRADQRRGRHRLPDLRHALDLRADARLRLGRRGRLPR